MLRCSAASPEISLFTYPVITDDQQEAIRVRALSIVVNDEPNAGPSKALQTTQVHKR